MCDVLAPTKSNLQLVIAIMARVWISSDRIKLVNLFDVRFKDVRLTMSHKL